MGAKKPSKVLESLHRKVLKDLAQTPVTEDDTTRNLLGKKQKATSTGINVEKILNCGLSLKMEVALWKSGSSFGQSRNGIGRNQRSNLNICCLR